MSTSGTDPAAASRGDLRLLETDVARRLLSSTIPARVAYIATDGTPRVVATWLGLKLRGGLRPGPPEGPLTEEEADADRDL